MIKIDIITSPLSEGERAGMGLYVAPSIQVISQTYNEGLMQTWSTGIGTGAGPGPGAKPNDVWGDVWAEPTPPKDDDDWNTSYI